LESLSGDPVIVTWPEKVPEYAVRRFGKN
jgi:hypothetical protein